MRCFVVVATKGRPTETRRLLDNLRGQVLPPAFTVVIGAEDKDLSGIHDHELVRSGDCFATVSPKVGSSSQRNFGLAELKRRGYFDEGAGRFFCAFFDDDFRMQDDWILRAAVRFAQNDIVGLTGQVLADGVKGGGLSESEAEAYLKRKIGRQPHWASGDTEREIGSVYGCNMAFLDLVSKDVRFDEALPLYGWQEDRDYTAMARRSGKVIYFPGSVGVHLGIKAGRTSGLKFGYSQIANPLYLMKKGTMEPASCLQFVGRALLANSIRSLRQHRFVDYRGRLYGNILAVMDTIVHGPTPQKVQTLGEPSIKKSRGNPIMTRTGPE